jgi:hypothetical protein
MFAFTSALIGAVVTGIPLVIVLLLFFPDVKLKGISHLLQ